MMDAVTHLWLRPFLRLRALLKVSRYRAHAPRALALRVGLAFAPLMQRLALKTVRLYKLVVSPWLPQACRFTPTCSEYAAEAIEQYGVFSGTIRAIGRLFRCHPLHRGGFDPVK